MLIHKKNVKPCFADECSINIRSDLDGNNGPVPVNLTVMQIVSPDFTGNIRMNRSDKIDLICYDVFNETERQMFSANCHKHKMFNATEDPTMTNITINTLKCKSPVKTHILVNPIENHVQNVQFGFATSSGFVRIIDIYINITEYRPLTSQLVVGPGATKAYVISKGEGFTFRQDKLFPSETQQLYSKETQRVTICNSILHLSQIECDHYFHINKRFLARGHLAPAADNEYRAGYWASYSYANVAPQWQAINNGHWSSIESSIRTMAELSRHHLDVTTGTLGTLQLSDANGTLTNIYLGANGQFPVPAVFFKIVIDRIAHRAIVVIVLNNPYESVNINRLICPDQTKQIEWMSFLFTGVGNKRRRVDRTTDEFKAKGFVYTCRLKDFLVRSGLTTTPYDGLQYYRLLMK